jgi:hypothetical protein
MTGFSAPGNLKKRFIEDFEGLSLPAPSLLIDIAQTALPTISPYSFGYA